MTNFTSKATINKPVNEVYQFLADMNNHRQLYPENVIDWSSSVDEARFKIENMASLALKVAERVTDREVRIKPAEKPPFDLEIKWELTSAGDITEAKFTMSADLNMMMKMLATGPLQKMADHQAQKLTNILG